MSSVHDESHMYILGLKPDLRSENVAANSLVYVTKLLPHVSRRGPGCDVI
jgi:hypothetical protein